MVGITPVQFDFSLLANVANAKISQRLANQTFAGQSATPTSASASAELAAGDPPWRAELSEEDTQRLVQKALKSGDLISSSDRRRALASDEDTPKLFAAYEALNTLHALATAIQEGDISDVFLKRAETRLNEGRAEISSFLEEANIDSVTLLQGERRSSAKSDVAIARQSYDYTTKVLHSGEFDDPVDAWADIDGFTIKVDQTNASHTINVDLTGLANSERTLSNVTELINQEFENLGLNTRFQHKKIGEENDSGVIESDDYALHIKGSQTEKLTFTANTSQPSVYLLGSSGANDTQSAQFSKWTDLASASPTRATTNLFQADETVVTEADETDEDSKEKTAHSDTRFIASAAGPDGSVYALAETEGDLGDQVLRADKDLVLVKYDSAGQELWTRLVGSTGETEGTSLAVAADGRVAIGGSTTGELASNTIGGAKDGFVLLYNADGVELSARQQGTSFNDSVTSLAFDSTGALYVGGNTSGSLDGNGNNGGSDAYLEKLDGFGNRIWINQWGTADSETVTAITVDDTDTAIVATRENGEAFLKSVSGEDFTGADWEHALGSSSVTTLKFDGGSIYAGGETRLDSRTAGEFSGNSLSDPDAFVSRFTVTGATVSEDWFQRFGGGGAQTAADLAIHDGQLYLAGTSANDFGSASATGDKNAFLVSLNTADGTEAWAQNLTGRGGISSAAGIAVSADGDTDLDKFGLPSGKLSTGDTTYVTDRTSARPGDHFFISVDGGRQKKITIESGETYRTLTFKINKELVLDGKAEARRGLDGQTLSIKPSENTRIELFSGSNGKDLLSALSLAPGVLFDKPVGSEDGDSSSDAPPIVSLELPDTFKLTSKDDAEKVVSQLDSALRGIRKAYRYAIEDPTLAALTQGGNQGKSTQASPYQLSQLANLQAGLNRLSAGGGGGGGFFI